ncbi:hypothetical protein QOZ80_8AG0631220 [Eleusine coracana subsp. coracana]|nr:hypothetical protein QOZ80_8AG0631220 [Eleusine coracana subsp. coracana]
MSKGVATIVMIAMIVVASEAAAASAPAEDHALWLPGGRRPGITTRPRSPIFPGYPGARPSSPPSFPRPSPPSPPTTGGEFGFGVPSPRPEVPPLFGGAAPSPPSTDCVTALAGLMTCGTFLTGSAPDTPTPQSECCAGLSTFLNTSSAAGDGDRTLRCLCPVILGDVNRMLPKPIDPVRMMYLPIACGVVLPPQVLYICFTGQQIPSGRVPDILRNPSSSGRQSP